MQLVGVTGTWLPGWGKRMGSSSTVLLLLLLWPMLLQQPKQA